MPGGVAGAQPGRAAPYADPVALPERLLDAVLLDQALAISVQQRLQLIDLRLNLASTIRIAHAHAVGMRVDDFHFGIDVEFLGDRLLR